MKKFILIFVFGFILFYTQLGAINNTHIPNVLKDWKEWVLYDKKDIDCPIHYKNGDPICSYPSSINITLLKNEIIFKVDIKIFEDKYKFELPYSNENWTSDVIVNNTNGIVLGFKTPYLILNKGRNIVQGKIKYKDKPKYLQLPKNIALVSLIENDQSMSFPKVDDTGRLLLDDNVNKINKKGIITVSIYRKIIDGHPIKMKTFLNLRVSGQTRNVILDAIVLKDFYPTSIKSELNTKITNEKSLEVEVRAGEWTVEIDSYSHKNLSIFQLPKKIYKYANKETISLQVNESYRTIDVINGISLDPMQSNIPNEWKILPLYLLQDDGEFRIKQLYKNTQQQEDYFTLRREMWLGFEGNYYSIQDNIEANIFKIKRLEIDKSIVLNSVTLNNKPSLINKIEQNSNLGFSLKNPNTHIVTNSKYTKSITNLPVNGWNETFKKAQIILNLPPGWKIFTSFGSDLKNDMTWTGKWDIMDIFLILIFCVSIFKLFGFKFSILSGLFLSLLWQESLAPTYVWFFLLVLVVSIRLFENQKINKILKIVFYSIFVFTFFKVVIFTIYEIKTALNFQFEKSSQITSPIVENLRLKKATVEEATFSSSVLSTTSRMKKKMKKQELLFENQIDPNDVVQTGEGVPNWNWKKYNFYWQSEVSKNDKLKLVVMSPNTNRIFNILRIIGMLFLLFMFLKDSKLIKFKKINFFNKSLLLFFISLIFFMIPENINAQSIPSPKLLEEFKVRLLKPETCLPQCASIQNVDLRIDKKKLIVDLWISAGANLALPILGNKNDWLPQVVSINKDIKSNLKLDNNGHLWVGVKKGFHHIKLIGNVKNESRILLSSILPLRNVNFIETNTASTWKINSHNIDYIELVNLENSIITNKKVINEISPIILVERTFNFGIRWYIRTKIQLLNKIHKPFTLKYKILKNESILNKEIIEEDKIVTLNFNNSKNEYSWRSLLPIENKIEIISSEKKEVTEQWKIDTSDIWNLKYNGFEPEQYESNGKLMLLFKPWIKQKITLNLTKNISLKGQSNTIESSFLKIKQSKKYRDNTLKININSSLASIYDIYLPGIDKLESVTIDQKNYPLKIINDKISIPLKIKLQEVVLKWKEKINVNFNYNFPDINLSKQSVNGKISLKLPEDRWILYLNGPTLGPVVLFWGLLACAIIFAFILGRIKNIPIKTFDWILLSLGMCTLSIYFILLILAWIFVLKYKEQNNIVIHDKKRNVLQILIIILTLIVLIIIFNTVSFGLLNHPNMLISGNNSYNHTFNWYSDRIDEVIVHPTVVSISIWYYKFIMLFWSLWISFSLIKWLVWAKKIFMIGGIWSHKKVN